MFCMTDFISPNFPKYYTIANPLNILKATADDPVIRLHTLEEYHE